MSCFSSQWGPLKACEYLGKRKEKKGKCLPNSKNKPGRKFVFSCMAVDECKRRKPHNWSPQIYKLALTSLPAAQLEFYLRAGAPSAPGIHHGVGSLLSEPLRCSLPGGNHIIILILIIIDQSLWKSSLNSVEGGVRWQDGGRFQTAHLPKITAKVFYENKSCRNKLYIPTPSEQSASSPCYVP